MTQFSKKLRLTNGLTVIFERNTAADIVSLNIGVKVGSVNETDDESGLCHLIEHMVFKGTKSFKAGEIATIVEASGGELNAYTSLDQTVYYINVPSKACALGLKILKEMVFDANFDDEELAREKEVVVEEISRGKDSPQRVLGELLFDAYYDVHPYRRPVIGTAELVRGFARDKIVGFYKKWYRPQNMVLGVCGNIDEATLSTELEKLFRFEIPSQDIQQDFPVEPDKTRHRIAMQKMDIKATYFDIAFPIPNVSHEDVPAIDLMSHLLGEGDTSLLEQNTKEKEQLVHYVYSSSYTPKFPGMLVVGGMVDPKKINAALASIRRQIERVRTEPFAADKLERLKLLMQAQIVFDRETCEGTARKWMTYETVVGDHLYEEKYLAQILALTPADILRVAQKYLDTSKATFVVLHPPQVKISVNKTFFQKTIRKMSKRFERVLQYRDVEVYQLKNGMRVVFKENHRLPIVTLKLTALGGLRYEDARVNGISNLIAHTLVKGTKTLSQLQVAEKCEAMAAQLSGYAGRNSWGGSFSFLSDKLKEGVPFFADVIRNPAFNEEEVGKEIRLQLEAIKNRGDNPSQLAFIAAMKKLFAGHPYQYHMLGEAKVVKDFSTTKVLQFYERFCVPSNLTIAVVGDVVPQTVLDILDAEFSGFKSHALPKVKLKTPQPPKNIIKTFDLKNKQQAHVVVGFLGASLYDDDRYVFDVLNSILSGQGGRLFLELRDKQSLAYTVTSTMVEGLDTGLFGAYIGTEPAKVAKAVDGIFSEFRKLITTKVPVVEIERAKNYILGNHEIDHQKNGAIAMQLALNELYGIGVKEFFEFTKKVQKVTASDILRVANHYLNPDHCVISIVGPKEAKVF